MLSRAGYVVLVPERRGYGKSDGQMWWQETGKDKARVVERLNAETDDVLAAIDYLKSLPFASTERMAVMGWSFGGIVTMLAVSRSSAFRAAVDQAGGALTWRENAYVRDALVTAAGKATTPTLFLVARNDRTTESVTALAEIFEKRGLPHRLVIYEAFIPAQSRTAPGHAIFSAQGVKLWQNDVVEFLNRHLQ